MPSKFLQVANSESASNTEKSKGNVNPVHATADVPVEKTHEPTIINISAKIPRRSRRWWTLQARMQNKTVSEIIVDRFIELYGEPPVSFEEFADDPKDWKH